MADMDGLAEDCSNSIANELDSLQSCAKPLIWSYEISGHFKCQVSSIPSEMEAMVVYGVSAPSNCLLPANTVYEVTCRQVLVARSGFQEKYPF